MKIAAMMANGFEEVEALAVIDILKREDIYVDMISVHNEEIVSGAHNIKVMTDKRIADIDFREYDCIFLPGGMPGTNNLDACEKLCEAICGFFDAGKMLAAICAAPKVFGRLGILKGKEATCFPGFEECLEGAVCKKERVVTDGNVITSRGMGTAIDLGLKMVEIIKGKEEAKNLAKTIQYID